MKHLFTLKSLLLVLFAVLGGVNVWGETVTYQHVFTSKFANGTSTFSNVDWTVNVTNPNNYGMFYKLTC